jgi:hypothetical protein
MARNRIGELNSPASHESGETCPQSGIGGNFKTEPHEAIPKVSVETGLPGAGFVFLAGGKESRDPHD